MLFCLFDLFFDQAMLEMGIFTDSLMILHNMFKYRCFLLPQRNKAEPEKTMMLERCTLLNTDKKAFSKNIKVI